MALRQRMEAHCERIAEEARRLRQDVGFTDWAGSKKSGVFTLSDLDLDVARMCLTDALREVDDAIAAMAASVAERSAA